jgi:RNA polymerase sigma-70 factor (ECF subfamily)
VACYITHNREDAEEAVQEAFLKAFTKLEQFDEKAKFSTWLTRIVVNEALMKLRIYRATNARWISLTEQAEEGVPFDVADWAPNPEQLYSATELRGVLIRSLGGLSPALRVVFVLRDMAEMSGEEAGEVLGLTSAVIKVRLFRARLQLRERLSRYFRLPAVAGGVPQDAASVKDLVRDSA